MQVARLDARLDASVYNNKQRWNENKCKCKCKEELVDKSKCDKRFICNPSDCNCERDKSCDMGQYLDYKSCKCRRKIVGQIVEECSEKIDENKMIYSRTLNAIPSNDYKKVSGSCALYIILFAAFLVTSTVISTVFIYFHW